MNKVRVRIAGSVIMSLLALALVICPNVNRRTIGADAPAEQGLTQTEKAEFMYFVTSEDLDNAELKESLRRLEEEYSGRVTFEVKNVDKDKSLLNLYPVENNTPALLMMKPGGDVTEVLFKTAEYDKLKASVEKALAD